MRGQNKKSRRAKATIDFTFDLNSGSKKVSIKALEGPLAFKEFLSPEAWVGHKVPHVYISLFRC